MGSVTARVGQTLSVGDERAGTIVAAGENAKALEDRRVGMFGGVI